MNIKYEINSPNLTAKKLLALFVSAGIAKQGWTEQRMEQALAQSSLVVCAWDGEELLGVARIITDFTWVAYLSQLAVRPDLQRQGVGLGLMELAAKELGDGVSLITHSADRSTGFYERAGFELYSNVYFKRRKE